jgi:transglutaminase-like putative cysteine protease
VRFGIDHLTRYRFSRPIFLEPHVLRLTPRCDTWQRLETFELSITPEPAGRSDCIDAEGNCVTTVWFDGLAEELTMRVQAEAVTCKPNPFDFLPEDVRLPVQLQGPLARVLSPALSWRDVNPEVTALAQKCAAEASGEVLSTLLALNARLYERIDTQERHEAGLQSPAQTLSSNCGACRDQATLFMAACRSLGVPARFVSGYQQGDPDKQERELHAWAEAWVPGGGWRGFDPTHGLAVADRHVALAASVEPALAAPVTGSFRGTGVTAVLEHEVAVHTDAPAARDAADLN